MPRARLFCFPGVGRGSSIYERWPSLLGEDIEVCMVDLPGRDARAHELPFGRVDEIVDHLVPSMRAYLDVPFAFFGIDIGAILMYETARRLRREGGRLPGHLLVAAAMAPQDYFWAPTHHLPRERLFRGIRTMGFSLDERASTELALRAESAAMASYQFVPEVPLGIPVTAFWGERDFISPPGSVRNWREQTSAPFTFHVWPGSHDLVGADVSKVLDLIRDTLDKAPYC
jgi:medium-chain acyl-[acyl-carrier-protein] hydrolase